MPAAVFCALAICIRLMWPRRCISHLDTQVPWGRTVNQGANAWDLGPEAISGNGLVAAKPG